MITMFLKYHDLSTLIYKILIKNEKIVMSLNIYLVNENKHMISDESSLISVVKQFTLKWIIEITDAENNKLLVKSVSIKQIIFMIETTSRNQVKLITAMKTTLSTNLSNTLTETTLMMQIF